MRKQGRPVMSSGNHAALRGGCPVPRPPPAPLWLQARCSHLSVPVTQGVPMLTKPLSTLHSWSTSACPAGSLSLLTGGDSGQFTVSSSPTCPLSSSFLLFTKHTAASLITSFLSSGCAYPSFHSRLPHPWEPWLTVVTLFKSRYQILLSHSLAKGNILDCCCQFALIPYIWILMDAFQLEMFCSSIIL